MGAFVVSMLIENFIYRRCDWSRRTRCPPSPPRLLGDCRRSIHSNYVLTCRLFGNVVCTLGVHHEPALKKANVGTAFEEPQMWNTTSSIPLHVCCSFSGTSVFYRAHCPDECYEISSSEPHFVPSLMGHPRGFFLKKFAPHLELSSSRPEETSLHSRRSSRSRAGDASIFPST